jgi:hypothetical protein
MLGPGTPGDPNCTTDGNTGCSSKRCGYKIIRIKNSRTNEITHKYTGGFAVYLYLAGLDE